MAGYDYRTLIEKHFELFNLHDAQRLIADLADDVTVSNVPFAKTYSGRNGYVEFAKLWFDAFPDVRIEVKNVILGGDWATVEMIATATQKGILKTPMGDIPSLGRRGTLPAVELFRFREGKIVEAHFYFDAATLLVQTGALRPEMLGVHEKVEERPAIM